MVAMVVIPHQIMHAIFEGGKFTSSDAVAAGQSLAAFAIGTPAYVLAKVLQPGYFARQDTKTPMRFTIVTAVVNIVLCWPLFKLMGHTGCALATSIAGWVNLFLLWIGLRRDGLLQLAAGCASRMGRKLLCSVLMGAGVWGLAHVLQSPLLAEGGSAFWFRMAILVGVCAVGGAIYFALIFATRVFSIREVKSAMRRG